MPTARVNGITMYYEQHGAGQPLLLINGLGADMTLLAPVIAGLEQSFQVVALDNRGAGRTDKPDAPYTIALMAADTAGLMDVLSLERVDVLGISLGGRIALELALSCPDRVGRLVLVSTSARLPVYRGGSPGYRPNFEGPMSRVPRHRAGNGQSSCWA